MVTDIKDMTVEISPTTDMIYVGKVGKDKQGRRFWKSKADVTQQAKVAVLELFERAATGKFKIGYEEQYHGREYNITVNVMSRKHKVFGKEKLSTWWGLSYCRYLTIPRSVMQEMPDEWQRKMATLLIELDEKADWRPREGDYWVTLNLPHVRDGERKGKQIPDSLDPYRGGNQYAKGRMKATVEQSK